jgi:hypothetical protein
MRLVIIISVICTLLLLNFGHSVEPDISLFFTGEAEHQQVVRLIEDNANAIFNEVKSRLDLVSTASILVNLETATLKPKQLCPTRGIADPSSNSVTLYLSEDMTDEEVLAVFAHEVAHLFIVNTFPNNIYDIFAGEGLATYAAGSYWMTWQHHDFSSSPEGSLRETLNRLLDDPYFGASLTGPDCNISRVKAYTIWASFMDYLISSFGLEKLHSLLESAPQLVPLEQEHGSITVLSDDEIETEPLYFSKVIEEESPNLYHYKMVYGLTFAELLNRWLDDNNILPLR